MEIVTLIVLLKCICLKDLKDFESTAFIYKLEFFEFIPMNFTIRAKKINEIESCLEKKRQISH